MTPEDFQKLMDKHKKEIDAYLRNDAPREVGIEAVAHFKENFDKEGFVDSNVTAWQEVERRKPDSKWYGFDANEKPKYKSPKRTKDPILKDKGHLQEAIDSDPQPNRVIIFVGNEIPYAKVHNEGGTAYIFGKKAFTMPKRQFIGHSKALDKKIEKILSDALFKILNKQ